MLYKEGATGGVTVSNAQPAPHTYLESFLREVQGKPGASVTTSDVMQATWLALKSQEAADRSLCNVTLRHEVGPNVE
jgi:hypothetical protein